MAETDYTGLRARELLEAHAARVEAQDESGHEQQLQEARAKYPNAHVYFDPEVNDVVIDLSNGVK
jgi:hypothetical protein